MSTITVFSLLIHNNWFIIFWMKNFCRCGSPSQNMMSLAHPLCTGNVSRVCYWPVSSSVHVHHQFDWGLIFLYYIKQAFRRFLYYVSIFCEGMMDSSFCLLKFFRANLTISKIVILLNERYCLLSLFLKDFDI